MKNEGEICVGKCAAAAGRRHPRVAKHFFDTQKKSAMRFWCHYDERRMLVNSK